MSMYSFKFYNAILHEHDEQYVTYRPKLVNAKCPHCASHPLISKRSYKVLGGYEDYYLCPVCEKPIDPESTLLAAHDDLTVVEMKEATTVPLTVTDEDLSSVAKGIKNSKNQKVRITFDEQDMEVPVITPQPRSIRYTPEFLEKAAKAMRDTPLKRQNIRVHEDDMESICPACGYMLYEEANMIFNYCPTCGQALNNNDFSEDEE